MENGNTDDLSEKPMDEFGWEEFLKKNDEMVDKYSALLEKYIDNPNRDEIIAREMGWSDREKDDGIERPWLDEFNESLDQTDDEIEEGEEWKAAAGIKENSESEIPDFHDDPLYGTGFSFAVDFMNWFKDLPETVQQDADIIDAMRNAGIPGAKIAGATGMGDDDKDQLGMRLAIYKRGLIAANNALTSLSAAKEKNIVDAQTLFGFIKRATELRNGLAARVLEIRDRFNSM